jgi:glucokinase
MTRELLPQYPASVIPPDSSAQEVYSAGLRGDELALEVFRRMGVHLGVGLANLINILNPEVIVLAGGVANGWELFEKYMRQEVAGRAFPLPAARVQIVQGQCGDDAGMLGVAHLAFVKGE